MEEKKCRISWQTFIVNDGMEKFLETISPVIWWKKYLIPTPTVSPEERMRRRSAFRNERSLYHRTCELTGNQVISIYAPERGFKVLSQKAWWGDGWDGKTYGRDFDFTKNFTQQFGSLLIDVPRMNLVQQWQSLNADYCNCVSDNKNSYLIFNASDNEGCAYWAFLLECKNTFDCLTVYTSENCYKCVDCTKCYECFYCQDTKNSTSMFHCIDCQNCQNCFACVGLRGKKDGYYILNKKVDKSVFEDVLLDAKKQKQCLEHLKSLYFSIPKKYTQILFSEKSSGCYIEQVKDSSECWDCVELENCHYCNNFMFAKNSYDVSYYWVTKTNEFIYECEGVGHGLYNIVFSKLVWGETKNLMYCYECFNCENCFGCTWLKSQKYCIFNKQYTKQEYEELVPKIIKYMGETGEWGEFFSPSISPFGYNETVAIDFFPLSEKNVKAIGYNWREDVSKSAFIGQSYTPLDIWQYDEKNVGKETAEKNIENCLQWIMSCQVTQRNFRIIRQELEFYIKYRIEIPLVHPDIRYRELHGKRLPRKLYMRNCQKCKTPVETPYNPEKNEIVYCEKCYNEQMY